MSETFVLIQRLAASGEVRVSEHGYDELAEDEIGVAEILAGVGAGTVVEDYPDYAKGRSVLVLQLGGGGRAIHGAANVTHRQKTKYIHEGQFVAEVEVELIDDDSSWSPYLSVADATRLDKVHEALRRGDVKAAASLGRVYRLEPVVAT